MMLNIFSPGIVLFKESNQGYIPVQKLECSVACHVENYSIMYFSLFLKKNRV